MQTGKGHDDGRSVMMSHSIWISHGTHVHEEYFSYECVKWYEEGGMALVYEWVMAHGWMSHVTHAIESWHTDEWVMAQIFISRVTHVNESCHTYTWMSHVILRGKRYVTHEWVMAHVCMIHVTHTYECVRTCREACHTYELVMAHAWMSLVTQMNESRHTHECVKWYKGE